MLVALSGCHLRPLGASSAVRFVGRICEDAERATDPARELYLLRSPAADTAELPGGFRGYLFAGPMPTPGAEVPPNTYALSPEMHHLAHGDIVRIDPARRAIRALYRRSSTSNSFLVTERCDNFCLMCSQPPKERDDGWLVDELAEVIPLVSPETNELGITGGEPALLGDRLVDLIRLLRDQLPATAIHVLTNGRRFADADFARRLGRVKHPDLMLGIPLYADLPEDHDYVVQARGAWDETVRGILNLKRHGVRVEIRFVIHADTVSRLAGFTRFVARNLLFVDHVALMGLEPVGFAKTNLDALWVDPVDYQGELVEATETLASAGMHVSIYNHQLCVLDPRLHPFARRSISDWKNAYFAECEACAVREACGGFFASAAGRRSRGIRAVP